LLLAVAAAGIGLTVLGGGPGRSFGTYVSAQTRGSAINIKGYEQSGDQKITPEGQRQIAALMEEKESRTPAQQKIDSNILFEIKKHRGQEIARGVATLETGLDIDENNGLKVDIHADVSRGLLEEIRDGGGIIMDSLAAYHSILAWLPLDKIERLAERADIKFVRPHADGQVWKNNSAANDIPSAIWNKDRTPALVKLSEMTGPGPSFAERAQRVQEYLRARLDGIVPEVGSQQSQGDTTHAANTYRSTIGPDGAGLKIGVLSNGVVSLAASQALGDLGPVTVLPGQVGTGDEGTAMLEIVHDLAPGAQLYFATANPLPARFASNVRDLRAAGCDIIIDDVFYFVETPFQDGQLTPSNSNGGVVIQAVKDVTAAGAMYFSSAGNQGNQDDNTASCYQGDWADGGVLALAVGGNVHDFGAGAQSDLIQTGSGNRIDLYWADPLNGSNNDYDLYVFNNALGAVVASSTNVQTGTQDPFEEVATGNTTNNRVVVLKKTGAANRFFHITINANGVGKLGTSTNGTTKGHSIPVDAYSVSATPAAAPGPFPAAHSAANVSETFTSDGPRRIFFSENGTAFTPGNFSSTGGILRQKPDITAADRVSVTGVGGFPTTFSGTSAAAPHAGAIAALLKSGLPTPTNAQIRTALLNSAIDIETAGVDRDTGVGIIMPIPAAGLLGITSQASVDKTGFTFTERPGNSDGDGQVEKGERANLVITSLINTGAQTATGVTASVTSNTAGVTTVPGSPLAPESLAYPNIGGAGGTGSNANPYTFVLGPAYVCGSPINFTLTVTYNDGSAKTKIINFTVDPSAGFAAADTVDVTPPASTAFYTGATGTQVNRVTRDSQSSTCSNPKAAFPGTTLATTPGWDSYTFTAPQSGCTVVTFSGGPTVAGGTQTFSTVYQGSFVPASIGTNYVADAGSSPTAGTSFSYSFNAVAGTQYVVVISTVPGTAPNPPYTLSVKGPGTTVCNFAPATAASVNISGRVLTSGGIPIRNASVVLQDGNNNVRYAITSSLGYYTFEDVPIGDYVIGVSSKRYNFSPRLLNVLSEVQDADLIADPE
jgi:hypothetical protein